MKRFVTNKRHKLTALDIIRLVRQEEQKGGQEHERRSGQAAEQGQTLLPVLDPENEPDDGEPAQLPTLQRMFKMDVPLVKQGVTKPTINTAPQVFPNRTPKASSAPAAVSVAKTTQAHVRENTIRRPATPQQAGGPPMLCRCSTPTCSWYRPWRCSTHGGWRSSRP